MPTVRPRAEAGTPVPTHPVSQFPSRCDKPQSGSDGNDVSLRSGAGGLAVNASTRSIRTGSAVLAGLLAIGLVAASGSAAFAATTINGPIELGAAETFGVLASSEVTNTGPTTVNGDVGVDPGTAITGFTGAPQGQVNGTTHSADALASQAQTDLSAAIVDAAGLTPTTSGVGNLSGLSLTPGVYAGGELSINGGGLLTLAGTAQSIWVFQAASTLTVGSSARVLVTGGASACNVFWQIGSSATIGTDAAFVGTVLAGASITANTGATIQGRLLADTAAVTLQSNVITRPVGCAPAAQPVETDGPEYSSLSSPDGTVATPYSYTYVATGAPSPTFSVTAGTLPTGLTLDSATGVLSGTPTTAGTFTFTVTASNGTQPDVSTLESVVIGAAVTGPAAAPVVSADSDAARRAAARLAATGAADAGPAAVAAAALLVVGGLLVIAGTRPRHRHRAEPAGRR